MVSPYFSEITHIHIYSNYHQHQRIEKPKPVTSIKAGKYKVKVSSNPIYTKQIIELKTQLHNSPEINNIPFFARNYTQKQQSW